MLSVYSKTQGGVSTGPLRQIGSKLKQLMLGSYLPDKHKNSTFETADKTFVMRYNWTCTSTNAACSLRVNEEVRALFLKHLDDQSIL